jgi:hypothetical protein
MSIGSINAYTSALGLEAYQTQIDDAPTFAQKKSVADTSAAQGSASSDRVEISKAAKIAYEKRQQVEPFSARAYKLLKIRGASESDIDRFQTHVHEARSHISAKEYLQSLSQTDRDLIKRSNSYGIALSSKHIETMSEEGARNLLVEPDRRAFVDYNNDGIVEHGAGKTFLFPPPNAPEEIKTLWDDVSEDMSFQEKMRFTGLFMVLNAEANAKYDSSGTFQGFFTPGEEGYTNIFPTEKAGWKGLLKTALNHLEWEKEMTQEPKQRERINWQQEKLTLFSKTLFKENAHAL